MLARGMLVLECGSKLELELRSMLVLECGSKLELEHSKSALVPEYGSK